MIDTRRVAAAAAAFTLVSGMTAFAADLPVRTAPAYVAPLPLPTFTWAGPYFGLNAGYAFDGGTRFNLSGVTPGNNGVLTGSRPGSFRNQDSGFTAGGTVGYNYQFPGFASGYGGPGSGVVVGVEADAAYTDLNKVGTFLGTGNTLNTFHSGLDFLGTVRGRVGYAFGTILVYGTGGLAYGDTYASMNLSTPGNPGQARFFGSNSDIQTGYTYGGGVEYAIPTGSFLNFFKSSAVTVKAEYLHYDLGDRTITANAVAGNGGTGGYSARVRNDGDLVRAGINYKF